jgi:hypothetical protein
VGGAHANVVGSTNLECMRSKGIYLELRRRVGKVERTTASGRFVHMCIRHCLHCKAFYVKHICLGRESVKELEGIQKQ